MDVVSKLFSSLITQTLLNLLSEKTSLGLLTTENLIVKYLMVKIFHDKPSLFTPRENTKIEKITELETEGISRARMNYMERRKSDELWMKTEV